MEFAVETVSRLFDTKAKRYFDRGDIVTISIVTINGVNHEETGKIINFNNNHITIDCSTPYNAETKAYEYDSISSIELGEEFAIRELKNGVFNIRNQQRTYELSNGEITNLVKETLDETGIPYTENDEDNKGSMRFLGLRADEYNEE